jgi:hypothetical protein
MPRYIWNAVVVVAGFVGVCSCSVSDTGLGLSPDASTGTPSATPVCYLGTIDRANWPAGATNASCSKSCGPDDLGIRVCSQIDLASCQATAGCVCVSAPCTKCANCALLALPDCYVPTNAASPENCATSVKNGGDCTQTCGKVVCIQGDGKTGCVCNAQGKYACAPWEGTTWK